MNELQTQTNQLPDTLPDLAKFVLVGREKLVAVRAEINAIQKVGLAKEVLEQKRVEAQEIAELVTLSEVKIGKMLKEIPKASGGDRRSESFKKDITVGFEKPKSEVLKEIGIPEKTAQRFQIMADNEDIVHEAIAEAKAHDDIVSRTAVLKKITEEKLRPLKEAKNREVREAKQRHEEFTAAKESSVVSFADATQDREDKKLLSEEFMISLNKALMSIVVLRISNKTDSELDDLLISDFNPELTKTSILMVMNSLNIIREAVERRC